MMPSHSAPADARSLAEISAVLGTYFDGLYRSDTERLARVFHPAATYACASDGTLLIRPMAEYLPIVAARPAPADSNLPRQDRIIGIELAGPVTALARVECAIAPHGFIDLLTLIRIDGRWQIIAKVFHRYTLTD